MSKAAMFFLETIDAKDFFFQFEAIIKKIPGMLSDACKAIKDEN